jgi:sigma-B regulation protein RsbU (phosphoserine phosphatase)
MFVFFSDGILDASNKAEELFGRERVGEIVATNPGASAAAVVESIFQAVAAHASGEEAFDDQTVVVIRVKGTPGKRK